MTPLLYCTKEEQLVVIRLQLSEEIKFTRAKIKSGSSCSNMAQELSMLEAGQDVPQPLQTTLIRLM
jgi:hypothetical protein